MKRHRIVRTLIIVTLLVGGTIGLRYWVHYYSLDGRMERGHQIAEEMRTYYYEHKDFFDELPSKAETASIQEGIARTDFEDATWPRTMDLKWDDGSVMTAYFFPDSRISILRYRETYHLNVEFLYLLDGPPDDPSADLGWEVRTYDFIPLENHWYICIGVG